MLISKRHLRLASPKLNFCSLPPASQIHSTHSLPSLVVTASSSQQQNRNLALSFPIHIPSVTGSALTIHGKLDHGSPSSAVSPWPLHLCLCLTGTPISLLSTNSLFSIQQSDLCMTQVTFPLCSKAYKGSPFHCLDTRVLKGAAGPTYSFTELTSCHSTSLSSSRTDLLACAEHS